MNVDRPLRIGFVGAGENTRRRHFPGFLEQPNVVLAAVCNRRPESTAETARQYRIPRTFTRWEDLVADPDLDAVVIGTWPYLHCPVALAALAAGKHVLTEARLSRDAREAHRMLEASRRHDHLVTQVVPSPFGLAGHDVVRDLMGQGFLGELREVQVHGLQASLANAAAPLSWRQDAGLSGFNMLTLGIVHETLLRWAPPPVRVLAQVHAHIPARIDPTGGVLRDVGTPDSVQVLAILEGGARATYHFSGVVPYGQSASIRLFGTEGALAYDLMQDRLFGTSGRERNEPLSERDWPEIPIPPERRRVWSVEADFVRAIREGTPIRFTDFATGVAYMEFTEAVARSAQTGSPIDLPLEDLADEDW